MLQERRVGDGSREATAARHADAHVLERRDDRSEIAERNHGRDGKSWERVVEEVKLGGPTVRWAELKMADTKDKVGKVAAGRDRVSDTSNGEVSVYCLHYSLVRSAFGPKHRPEAMDVVSKCSSGLLSRCAGRS
jgi:hypothetical protein